MWNERTLEADIEYAAELVREGLATERQAAQACGIPLPTLQAHLTGAQAVTSEAQAVTPETLKGSASSSNAETPETTRRDHADVRSALQPAPAAVETTDYFVFYREESRWVWKRVDQGGNVVKTCEERFPFYLDCVADARPHGFNGRPLFIFAASDIAALNAPDKPR